MSDRSVVHTIESASRFASEVRRRWEDGEAADTAAVLHQRPDLKEFRSVVLDLACQEYQQRVADGESLDAEEFSRRFPSMQRSLFLLIEVGRLMDQDPELERVQETAPWPDPGEMFLGFSLKAELGRGAFARVFLATEPALGDRPVAVKVSVRGGKEAEMLGKLRHPNIVPVHSVREDTETEFSAICMPYLGRTTLCDVLDHAFERGLALRSQVILDAIHDLDKPEDGQPDASDRILSRGCYVDGVVHLVAQLADALAYTHSHGICHGDLKPSNVVISLAGRPLLLDFNLSQDEQVPTSRIGGTLPYMAPEQVRGVVSGRLVHASPRSDLFSLGVIFYQLLCGDLPFAPNWNQPMGDVASQLLAAQERGPPPLSSKNPYVGRSLARLVHACLAFEPQARPASAEKLAAMLRRELNAWARLRRWSRHHPWRAGALAAAWISAVAAIAAVVYFADPPADLHFRHGLQCEEREDYAGAIAYYNEAMAARPEFLAAIVARGRAQQRLGHYTEASTDLRRACEWDYENGEIRVWLGFCLAKNKEHDKAIVYLREAIARERGSPAVFNNLGYCCLMTAKPEEAVEFLSRAVQDDPDLQAAQFNLASALATNRSSGGSPATNLLLAAKHMRRAVELGPPSVRLYLDAAVFHARAATYDPALVNEMLEYLDAALTRGLDPEKITKDPVFHEFRRHAGFQALLAKPHQVGEQTEVTCLIDPL